MKIRIERGGVILKDFLNVPLQNKSQKLPIVLLHKFGTKCGRSLINDSKSYESQGEYYKVYQSVKIIDLE